MVRFKDVSVSGDNFLVIFDDERPMGDTRLRVYRPLIGQFARAPPKLTNSLYKPIWTCKFVEAKSPPGWKLLSAHHHSFDKVSVLSTLGRRILEGKAEWGDDIEFVGEFCYRTGYWEWCEDVLSRCRDELQYAGIYDSVYASLFTYDRNTEVVKAFCEAWCSSTNTLLTSQGEMSISLWDLHILSGLPADGLFYDEVIPSADELFGTDRGGKLYVPASCSHLFEAYHFLRAQGRQVSIESWIKLWCQKKPRYDCPPTRKEFRRKVRGKLTHNPPGDFSIHEPWSTAEEALFSKLSIKEKYWKETYLAAYLSCWLCSFVLPEGKVDLIRPETFKMASILATQSRVSLSILVLASIYRGLNIISESSHPSQSRATLPFHFIYGWMAHYLKTHFPSYQKGLVPRMIQFAKEGVARFYDTSEARKRVCRWDQISWTCNLLSEKNSFLYVDDDKVTVAHRYFFMAIRSNFLVRRLCDCFVVEPYSPHRFSRQFGYVQTMPGVLNQDFREASLDDGLRYWRLCTLRRSLSKARFPDLPSNVKKLVSAGFRNWWDKSFSEMTVLASIPPQPKDTPILQKEKATDSLKGKKQRIEDDSAGSIPRDSNDRHWKRRKGNNRPDEQGRSYVGDSRDEMDGALNKAMKDVLGFNVLGGFSDCSPVYSTQSVNICLLDEPEMPESAPLARVTSPLPSKGVVSKFDGRVVFDDRCRPFLEGFWGDLLQKIMRTPLDDLSSIHEKVLDGLSLMERTPHSFDLSHLRKGVDTLFANVAAYDSARSASSELHDSSKQRIDEVKIRIQEVEIKRQGDFGHFESVEGEIAALDEKRRTLCLSLEEYRTSYLAAQREIKDLKEELTQIEASFNEESHKSLKSSKFLVETSRKTLEDLHPFI